MGYITLSGDETDCSMVALAAKVASGPKPTLAAFSPRILPSIRSGTAQAGAAGTITLDAGASAIDGAYVGCIVQTTGGTGGAGGSGKANNQARVITGYVGSTKVATVEPNWETNPDNTTTFKVLLTDVAANALPGGVAPKLASTGHVGIDWANIANPTTAQDLSSTTIEEVANAAVRESVIAGYIDTEVAAIKAKTDNLPADPAGVSDVPDAATIATAVGNLALAEPSAVFDWGTATLGKIMAWLGAFTSNRKEQTASQTSVLTRDETTTIATADTSDDGTTAVAGSFTSS